MFTLNNDLDVLLRAIGFRNLSAAAEQIGISQSQLSRIVQNLEQELGVTLLDRSSRRHSSWTIDAMRLAQSYRDLVARWSVTTDALAKGQRRPMLKIATLEGMMDFTLAVAEQLLREIEPHVLHIDPFEVGDLEENMERQHFDLVFTCREPGKKHFHHSRRIGYQYFYRMEREKTAEELPTFVMSPYEFYQKQNEIGDGRIVISNSLATRMQWVERYGGQCDVPSQVLRRKTSAAPVPVILLGAEDLPEAMWKRILAVVQDRLADLRD